MVAPRVPTNRRIPHMSAVQHPTHARGLASPDIMAAVQTATHHARIAAVVITVPVARTVHRVQQQLRPVHQHRPVMSVCPVAVGVIMNTVPVQMIVSVIGISVMKPEQII